VRTEVDHSTNRMAIMGKGEAGINFGVGDIMASVRRVTLHRDGRGIEKWYRQCP